MRVRLSTEIAVPSGPTVSFARSIAVDATDVATAQIEPGDSTAVEVQPSPADRVQLLVITASAYGSDLTYQVGSSTQSIALDSPQVFTGSGMIGRLPSAPQTLTFDNGLAEAVTITVVAGRTIA